MQLFWLSLEPDSQVLEQPPESVCLEDLVGIHVDTCSHSKGRGVRAHSLVPVPAGPHRASAWAAVSASRSEWTGPWDQISEPGLLTHALQRKPFALRLGSDFHLCLDGLLPSLPDSWVELWPQSPSRLLSISVSPTLNPFTALHPMQSGPQDISRGPSPQATFSAGDPGPRLLFFLFPEG